jgi:hypothetical protein
MKLWDDAFGLTGAKRGEAVRNRMTKYYVVPRGQAIEDPLPLARLTFLHSRARRPETPLAVKGAERMIFLLSALYRRRFCQHIIEHRSAFAALQRIGTEIPMTVFDRPMDKSRFDEGVELITTSILEHSHG